MKTLRQVVDYYHEMSVVPSSDMRGAIVNLNHDNSWDHSSIEDNGHTVRMGIKVQG